jgi:sugar porter (SP) family MFS transporter
MSNADAADVDALNEAAQSLAHTRFEHELGFWQAARHYRSALLWAFFANLAVILCGFDGALIGSLVGLAPFNRNYGHLVNGAWSVPPHWLSAFNYASYVGSIPGALIGGSMYDKFGPRVCLAAFSLGSIASIFLQFFSEGSAVLFVGELFNGAVTGGYPVIANAYISEVTPLAARGVASAFLNLSYVIGQLVASGMLKGTSTIDSKWSYKIPFATQWILPLFVLSLVFFMPTSAYWLCKNGRYEDARRSLRRLTTGVDVDCQVANIKETIRLEKEVKSQISILECFHGTNLRRTLISCQVFNIQALCGNILFINYAVYFFEIAGLDAADAFSMNIGLTCLGFVGTVCSYILISYAGRRTIYLVGTAAIAAMVLLIGILGAVPSSAKQHSGTSWAMCSLMVITDLIYDLSVGPLCFTVMAEISSVKLRGITIALSNISVVVFSVVFAVAIPYALDVNGANWGGKLGFLFFGIGIFNTAWVYFCLPETKYRTFEELDIMFQNKVPTRQFKAYHIEGTHVAEEEVTA